MSKKPPTKTTKKSSKKTIETEWNPKTRLTLSEELFCRYFVLNEQTWRNGVRSYDAAYGKKLEERPRDDAVYEFVPSETKGAPPERRLVQPSSYDRCYNVCQVEAFKLLRKPKISKRINALLNELLGDDFVDGELAKVIAQDEELNPKIKAIQEYNKMNNRTVQQIEHTHSFAKYDGMTDAELEREIAQGEKFFNKK